MFLAPYLVYRAYKWRPRATLISLLTYAGVLGSCGVVGGAGRLFLRFYAPERIWTPWITDPGPSIDAVAFMAGLVVVILTAAALLELTAPQRRTGARR